MISLRRIFTIMRKDLRDAIRDNRVLIALILPLGIGIFYNYTFDEGDEIASAKVIYYSAESSILPRNLSAVIGDTLDLRFREATSIEEVEQELQDDQADLGFIIPAGFDVAIQNSERPELRVIEPREPTIEGDYLIAAIDPALRMIAGQDAPLAIIDRNAAEPDEESSAIDKVGLRNWAVLASITMMMAMISMLAIPVILAEEKEKKTLDALILVASMREVIAAKVLLGAVYVAVMVPILLAITRLDIVHLPLFIATVAAMTIALIGLGLLMAGFFSNANQLNTWSGIVLLPVIAPAFIIGIPAPSALQWGADLFPTGAGTRLLMNTVAEEQVFGRQALSFLIIIAWAVAGYLLLFWRLRRQEA